MLRVVVGVLPAVLLAWALYAFNLFAVGPVVVLFVVNLMVMGWWVSLGVVSLILRHGAGAEALAWSVLFGLTPLAAVFPRVRIENDCLAALQAERRWGALQGLDHCAYVTWSTGIGMGVCVDGHILRGKNGNAGHAGHTFVSDNLDALCGCGNVGDVEGLIAGNAIARRFGAQGFGDAAALLEAARAGHSDALALVDELCRVMGRAIYNLVVTLDLQRVSMGGSVFWHHRDFLLPKVATHVQGKLTSLTDGVEIVPAGLGNAVGDYAALALVMRT